MENSSGLSCLARLFIRSKFCLIIGPLKTLLKLCFKKVQLETPKAMANNSTNVLCSSDHLYVSEHCKRNGRSTLPISHMGNLPHRSTHSFPAGSHLLTHLVTKSYMFPREQKKAEWAHPVAYLHIFLPDSHHTNWWALASDTETLRLNVRKPKVSFQNTSSAWVARTLIHSSSDVFPSRSANSGSYFMPV